MIEEVKTPVLLKGSDGAGGEGAPQVATESVAPTENPERRKRRRNRKYENGVGFSGEHGGEGRERIRNKDKSMRAAHVGHVGMDNGRGNMDPASQLCTCRCLAPHPFYMPFMTPQNHILPIVPQYAYSLLVGNRDLIQHKLHFHVKCSIPFYDESTLINSIAANLNGNNGTLLGLSIAAPCPESNTPFHMESTSAQIATHGFDILHSAMLKVLAVNCDKIKTADDTSAFCMEACSILQDCVGLICLNGNSFAGKSIMFAFDTPELSPLDIERRLRGLFPSHAMDPRNLVTSSIPTGNMLLSPPPKPINVHQLPHSTLHILPGVASSFLAKALGPDSLLDASVVDERSVGKDLAFSFGLKPIVEGMPVHIRTQVEEIKGMLEFALPKRVEAYDKAYKELEDLMNLAQVLARISPEDVVREVKVLQVAPAVAE
ncbi:hypothetical protein BC829DRAFT_386461 [Chytridium lagenaria]|nr:hypothetical protein BC829DRAFT_386461 [Chytridium lagenaria]